MGDTGLIRAGSAELAVGEQAAAQASLEPADLSAVHMVGVAVK